jgi:hypothetical protein
VGRAKKRKASSRSLSRSAVKIRAVGRVTALYCYGIFYLCILRVASRYSSHRQNI